MGGHVLLGTCYNARNITYAYPNRLIAQTRGFREWDGVEWLFFVILFFRVRVGVRPFP